MAVNDLEYKELHLDLVDLTEGVVGSFLFYYDEEVKKIYELPPQKRGAEQRKKARAEEKRRRKEIHDFCSSLRFSDEVYR